MTVRSQTLPQTLQPDPAADPFLRFARPAIRSDSTPAEVIATAKAFSAELAAGAAERDRTDALPLAELERARELGLTAIRVPREYGGPLHSYRTTAEVLTQIAKGDSSVAQVLIPHLTTLERIRLSGSAAQKTRYIGAILHGAVISGATTERGKTRIRTDMSTTLVEKDGRLLINGTKYYSTGGLLADILRITAKDEAGRTISVILPRGRAGIEQLDDWRSMGQRGTSSGTTILCDVEVFEDEIVPFNEDERTRRNYQAAGSQLLHSSIDLGIALAILDDTAAYARDKARVLPDAGVASAAEDPYVLHMVGQIAARTHVAQAALYAAAEVLDRAHDLWHAEWAAHGRKWDQVEEAMIAASITTAEAKTACNEAVLRSADLLFEVGGASATAQSLNLDRHWRNARTHTTHDATAYKFKVIGNYYVNGTPPPVTLYY
ncbi:dehydrogenase [Sinirhodobacter populi]|uniref:Dibenzothiophene monooxygenase n=1 Tax=Paenirhodobacter populi TaxID=2306993 RepID=A0A443K4K8_9RHOB|nr:acyl-CoA dehydrogenase family protein [Sinirhodobacter populi]RWR27701.1 dehydrogenase [Sinirhodobacter populi]